MTKTKSVQFQGFRADKTDKSDYEKHSFDRLQFDHEPAWLKSVMESTNPDGSRLYLDSHAPAKPPALFYKPNATAPGIPVELNAHLIDLGKGKLRVVDDSTFKAVSGLHG